MLQQRMVGEVRGMKAETDWTGCSHCPLLPTYPLLASHAVLHTLASTAGGAINGLVQNTKFLQKHPLFRCLKLIHYYLIAFQTYAGLCFGKESKFPMVNWNKTGFPYSFKEQFYFCLYFSFVTGLLCVSFVYNFLSVLSLPGRNRHLHQVWGEEVLLILDFQNP